MDYILIRQRDRKWVSNIRVIQGEACIPQHKLVICDMKLVENLKKRKETIVSKCRIWKLKEDEVHKHFEKKIEARKEISPEGKFVEKHKKMSS